MDVLGLAEHPEVLLVGLEASVEPADGPRAAHRTEADDAPRAVAVFVHPLREQREIGRDELLVVDQPFSAGTREEKSAVCEGRVMGACAKARVNATPSAASASSAGVS